MLVIDRRDDQGAYAPGSNRAEVQAELEKHNFHTHGLFESTAVPVQVDVEDASMAHPPSTTTKGKDTGQGVNVVMATPGPDKLLKLMMRRVWGIGR